MITIVLTFLKTFWKPVLIGILVLAFVGMVAWWKHKYDEERRDEGRAEVQAEWDADKAERVKLTTAMTLLWDNKRQDAEKIGEERDRLRMERTESVARQVASLPPAVAHLVIPADAVRVLSAGADSANAAGTPSQPEKAIAPRTASADSNVGLLTGWAVTVLDILAECRDRVSEWEVFYASLRAAQPKGTP